MPSLVKKDVFVQMKRGNFFVVLNQSFDYKLSPIEFYVYCYLCKCRNKKRDQKIIKSTRKAQLRGWTSAVFVPCARCAQKQEKQDWAKKDFF